MGYMHKVFLSGTGIYGCSNCGTHLAFKDKVSSKSYTGQYGTAYLVDEVTNVRAGEAEKRNMTTGAHIVRDIVCMECNRYLGWTYVTAFTSDQKFKEGKFILERSLICDRSRNWD
ncbi:hypothetical protein GGH91_000383 [Coemansia sp. RSA 2671]|uniref:Protein yippee-like n=1 Tax=Coemansia spiralis TaxID=417178 RepID=A0A9W8GI21_9FUNG|nr:hypothetical protein GGI06_004341 [Coemansia sp. S85]KAJ2350131.1 hypothetical protein GGH91_000383 [Coemansia sp. RSA 2671]KAJ2413906.1 hypothetical protein GGI10_002748 [Coemansia sp. RSA 2530]KAJ2687105.1 protein yippee-like moh1 [Coemansia spiralis]KAJ2699633.1 protein yippee-like moh1 [Coemansia sp. IMI 209128]